MANPTPSPSAGPSPLLRALEVRAPFEYAAMAVTSPFLRRVGGGDGHPVLVLPGFTADDRSTRPLRGATVGSASIPRS